MKDDEAFPQQGQLSVAAAGSGKLRLDPQRTCLCQGFTYCMYGAAGMDTTRYDL